MAAMILASREVRPGPSSCRAMAIAAPSIESKRLSAQRSCTAVLWRKRKVIEKPNTASLFIHSPVDEEVLAGEMLEVIVDCKSATYSLSMNVSTPSKYSTHVQLAAQLPQTEPRPKKLPTLIMTNYIDDR